MPEILDDYGLHIVGLLMVLIAVLAFGILLYSGEGKGGRR